MIELLLGLILLVLLYLVFLAHRFYNDWLRMELTQPGEIGHYRYKAKAAKKTSELREVLRGPMK